MSLAKTKIESSLILNICACQLQMRQFSMKKLWIFFLNFLGGKEAQILKHGFMCTVSMAMDVPRLL